MAYLIVLVLGFLLTPQIWAEPSPEPWQDGFNYFLQSTGIGLLSVFTYFLCLFLMGSICPKRQAIMEWSRQPQHGIADLIWSDKSPAIMSFGILLTIANLILIPVILLFHLGIQAMSLRPWLDW